MVRIGLLSGSTSDLDIILKIRDELEAFQDWEICLVLTAAVADRELFEISNNPVDPGRTFRLKSHVSHDRDLTFSSTFELCSRHFGAVDYEAIVIVGDRFEALAGAIASHYSNIPIVHIHGGESTPNSLDDLARHAISTFASLHFVATPEARLRLLARAESPESVIFSGPPAFDFIRRGEWVSRSDLAGDLGLDPKLDWYLFSIHPDSNIVSLNVERAEIALREAIALGESEIIFTGANDDPGGAEMNIVWEQISSSVKNLHYFKNLGMSRFLSLAKESRCVAGNSSAILHEMPYLGVPRVLIGDRQFGRNVGAGFESAGWSMSIGEAITRAVSGQPATMRHIDLSPSRTIAQGIRNWLVKANGTKGAKYVSV
jgi:UDP-hydrolysing UDP-N-acetyl-D-glucosamine 2-epimerase